MGMFFAIRNVTKISVLKFDNLTISPGKYEFKLEFTISDFITSGTMAVYRLNAVDWTDPGDYHYPPPVDSDYPTWSHQHYNSRPWEIPGAAGPNERGSLLQEHVIDSAVCPVFTAQVDLLKGQSTLAFVLQGTANVALFSKESSVSNDQRPRLTLIRIRSTHPPSLDGSPLLNPFTPLK